MVPTGLQALVVASERHHTANNTISDSRGPVTTTGLDPKIIEQQVNSQVVKILSPFLKNFASGKNQASKKAAFDKLKEIRQTPLTLPHLDNDVETRVFKELGLYKSMNTVPGPSLSPNISFGDDDDEQAEWIHCGYEGCTKKVRRQCELK
jgi:hypothetical protein